jgi:3-methyladenine DNA glycosylase AlkD
MADADASMPEKVLAAIEQSRGLPRGKARDLCDRRLYKEMPGGDDPFIEECDRLVCTGNWSCFWLVTLWIKRRQNVYELKYFPTYRRWLLEHIHSWGACDVYCYRVLNPMVEKFPRLFEQALQWAHSDQVYVRRASAVCLIQSTRYTFRVNVGFEKVHTICELLKSDPHLHIQKAVGWLLKYAYLTYPDQVQAYLRANLSSLSRTTFRYALEKTGPAVRSEFMRLQP